MNCLSSQSSDVCQRVGDWTSATGMKTRSCGLRRRLCLPTVTWLAFISLLSCLLASSEAKVFSRCELARELHRLGLANFRGYELADWVCLAYFTSGFNTAAVDHEADGSTNNGLFQINSRKWCRNLAPDSLNLCKMYCTDLLISDLRNTIVCVMKIVSGPKGLGYWEAWKHHCQGKDLRDWVDGCEL